VSHPSLFDPPGQIPGPPRLTEREKGERAVCELGSEPQRAGYLEAIREKMRRLYQMRVDLHGEHGAWVTADDAREFLELILRPPPAMSRNFLGATFKEPGWEVVGSYHSSTRGSHGNRLLKWKWVGAKTEAA